MAGFITNSVELIQRILFDGRKTDELLVLKELVQNADDARAEVLHVGISDGLPEADHPLLRGRGLYVVNDGPFTQKHARAVRSLGGSSKVEEDAAIGKFGIGLKSVFYLGEVFFYLCRSADEDGSETLPLAQVLNPWNNGPDADHPRPEWDGFSPVDRRRMREHLSGRGITDGFTIWVPLRTQDSTRQAGGELSVYQAYPGDDDDFERALFSPRVYREITGMLPLMRHLREVRFWAPGGPVTLDAGKSTRSHYPDVAGEHVFAGEVKGEGTPNLQFTAAEQLLATNRVRQLRESGQWPRRQVGGTSRQVEDKTRAHTAVVLKRQADEAPRGASLVIQWAVFLPLGESENLRIGGSVDFHVTLHGCFFITSDRRDILSWRDAPARPAETSSQLQQQWNAELARHGTLPMLLPTLAEFSRWLSHEEIFNLTAGINRSRLFSEQRGTICQRSQWVLTAEREWQLVPSGTRLLAFPRLEGPSPASWLPGWREVALRATLIEANAPHLMAGPQATWTDEELRTLFGGIRLAELDDPGLQQLSTILKTVSASDNWQARRELLASVLNLDLKTFTAQKEALTAVIETVPADQRFVLPKGVAKHIRERLALLHTSMLILPGELEVDGQAKLPWKDALTLLQSLAGQRGTVNAVSRVLNAVEFDDRAYLRNAVAHLPFIEVRTLEAKEPEFITPADAFQRVVRQQLYRDSETTREWAKVAAEAFVRLPVPMTDGVVIEALGGQVSSFDPKDFTTLIRQGAIFTGLEGRAALLNQLMTRNRAAELLPLVRVLLHGEPEQMDSCGPLYVVKGKQTVLERLAGQLLSARKEAWRVVPLTLADLLNGPLREQAQVQTMEASAVAKLVDTCGTAHIRPEAFSEAERLALVTELPADVARELPFHPARHGELLALSNQTLIPGGGELPEALEAQIRLLRPDARWEAVWNALGVQVLSVPHAIKLVLHSPEPSQHAAWIFDQIVTLDEETLMALQPQLSGVAWIPDSASEYVVSPGDVLVLPELAEVTTTILAEVANPYLDLSSLSNHLTSHPGFQRLVKAGFMLTEESAALALADVMQDHPQDKYRSGPPDQEFTDWWSLFGALDASAFPVLAVLQPLSSLNIEWARRVQSRMTGPVPNTALEPILNHLANLLDRSSGHGEDHDRLLRLHAHYLTQVKDRDLWRTLRGQLKLRSAAGKWRPAAELCVQAEGVAAQHLLHEQHHRLLEDVLTPHGLPEPFGAREHQELAIDASLALTPELLETYFAPWDGLVPQELIGAFLSLLGGEPRLEALAQRYLHPRSLSIVREIVESDAAQRPRNVGSFDEWVNLYRVTVKVSTDASLRVMSLTDEPIEVTKDTTQPSVIVGRPEPGRIHGQVYVTALTLGTLDLTRFSRQELAAALLSATRAVLRGMYLVKNDHLDDLWKELSESDQFDLLYTQDVIIQDSISYIRYQLGLAGQDRLKSLFNRWESARHKEVEEQRNTLVKRGRGRATAEIEKLRGELREFFEKEDPEVLSRLLEGVRMRVKDAQYIPSSIPFELLQNADDALEELQVLKRGGHVDDRFVVETGPDTLTFMHWGRAINQFALPGFDGEEHGFKADLKKMLMLSASDKGSTDLQVTGKFGMGFKSVYLLSERPRVVSGRLAFEVVGGVYPKRLAPELLAPLREQLGRHAEAQKGTAISLEVPADEAAKALVDFRAWLPLLLVFTRHIKQVVDSSERGQKSVSWQEVPLGQEGWRVGGVHPPHEALSRALVCTLPHGMILLPLGARGVTRLPDDVPTIWVTAPTRSYARAGLAINADFALDIGRSEVASRAAENGVLARHLGQEFGQALLSLHGLSQRWTPFQEELALSAESSASEFWKSVWLLLAEHAPNAEGTFAAQIVHTVVWSDEVSGYWSLIRERDTLPTGLTGDHDVLTSLTRVTHQVTGVLAREQIFEQFRDTATLSLQYPAGTLLHETVAARLHTLTRGHFTRPSLRLLDVLRAEYGSHPEVTSEQAGRLAVEYTRDRLATFGAEQDEIQEYLSTFRFQTVSGEYVSAQEIIVSTEDSAATRDERLRAGFAPSSRVLHKSYSRLAIDFVLLARMALRADAKTLVQWVSDAKSVEVQEAVIRYLLEGELAPSLATELNQTPAVWLSGLLKHPAYVALDENKQMRLAGLLERGHEYTSMVIDSASVLTSDFVPVRRVADPRAVLNDLYDEWRETADEAVAEYEEDVYPAFMRPDGTLLPFGEDRKRWMTLLLLGTYQSLGRSHPYQNRDFLQRAEKEGWLDTFSAPEVEPVEWFKILDGFLHASPKQEYYHWFSRFLATYQLSRHLDTYMSILLGMEYLTRPEPLDAILNPSSSALFSGSGIDVPDLRRALGIGRHFVLRELLRTGTVHAPSMQPEAFYPSASMRRAMATLGCPIDPQVWNHGDSRTIHGFLLEHLGEKRVTFQGAFDLPFVVRAPVL